MNATKAEMYADWKILTGIVAGLVSIIILSDLAYPRVRSAIEHQVTKDVQSRVDSLVAHQRMDERTAKVTQVEIELLAQSVKAPGTEKRNAILNKMDAFHDYAESLILQEGK